MRDQDGVQVLNPARLDGYFPAAEVPDALPQKRICEQAHPIQLNEGGGVTDVG